MSEIDVEGKEVLLTYRQVSRRYNLAAGTLYSLVRQGRIPHIRLGSRLVRFRREDIEKWLEASSVPSSERGTVR